MFSSSACRMASIENDGNFQIIEANKFLTNITRNSISDMRF
jgi:hypothetical protein